MTVPVAVLLSGRGSNFQALLAATRTQGYPARIELVLSNRADAGGLAHAQAAGIPTAVIDHKPFRGDRDAFDAALNARLRDAGVEIVALAGFMRLLSEGFVAQWQDRAINIHPSLLPAYPGLHTHARALADGVKLHGCTVHLLRTAMDTSPIIAQAAVPVLPDDTEHTLAARVLAQEHRVYPMALRLLAEGRVRVVAGRAVIDAPHATHALLNPLPPDAAAA